ncbi:unnamed protein product [Rangifer tarandus platyrhynchus]|uniref:Uncharacterized protein n=2 Tax=Rangifer tarandus platyrhynchus TaxID=3082113 RepID=A0ABN8YU61_RANTA|nr:unnamed protein product [Rangifer tarandus platyrhynchus]
MRNQFPIVLVLGASPPPDNFSFHVLTRPVTLGLPALTSHHYLFSLLDFPLMDVTPQLLAFWEASAPVNFVNFSWLHSRSPDNPKRRVEGAEVPPSLSLVIRVWLTGLWGTHSGGLAGRFQKQPPL